MFLSWVSLSIFSGLVFGPTCLRWRLLHTAHIKVAILVNKLRQLWREHILNSRSWCYNHVGLWESVQMTHSGDKLANCPPLKSTSSGVDNLTKWILCFLICAAMEMLEPKKSADFMSVCRHKTINKLKIVCYSRMQCGAEPFHREPSQKMRGEPSRTPPSSHLGAEKLDTRKGGLYNLDKFGCSLLEDGDKKMNNWEWLRFLTENWKLLRQLFSLRGRKELHSLKSRRSPFLGI